jgi:hypothetical protein
MQNRADVVDEDVRKKKLSESGTAVDASVGADVDAFHLKFGARNEVKEQAEVERSFKVHTDKLQELDRWLPTLKHSIREFFELSRSTKCIILQIDDLYHLKRTDQAFVVDYIHRLCKDLPLYFKIATLRHASTLFVGQPIGAQERHDYQPINIDYT